MKPCAICRQKKPSSPLTSRLLEAMDEPALVLLEGKIEREHTKNRPFARHYLKVHNRTKLRLLRVRSAILVIQRRRSKAS